MQKLRFTYEMQIEYSIDVARCNFTIKCVPKDTKRQKIENVKMKLFPATSYCVGIDGFRNTQIYGVNEIPHKVFNFQIEGVATTGLADYEEYKNDDLDMVFKHPYGLNVSGEQIRRFYETLLVEKRENVYEKAVFIMHALHQYLTYEPGSTNVNTTAEDAFIQRKGVCQDYSHIFISLLHLAGIPARYVTGLIVGEGASHAWVEILLDDKWYGLDPTNDKEVRTEHIKIGVGRDATDCMINRGIMHGGGLHVQTIKVNVRGENQ